MEEKYVTNLIFFVNGVKVSESSPNPKWTLLYYLRNKLNLTGTKLGCAEGGCGACTVMVSRYDHENGRIINFSVNACLTPVCSLHGMAITTVEGIGSIKNGLHPVQERIAKSFGSQCGFCTPGIVMSMYTLLRNNNQPSVSDLESAFEGNLCRCTGYRPILDGFKTFTKEFQCGMGDQCCRNNKSVPNEEVNGISTSLYEWSEFLPYESSQEPIFPPQLQLSEQLNKQVLRYECDGTLWYRPITLKQLLTIKEQYPSAKLVAGNTEIGIETKFKNQNYKVFVAVTHVPEMLAVCYNEDGVEFGASCTLTNIDSVLKAAIGKYPEHKTRLFSAVVEMLRWFAGHQIRNVAAVAGNIVTASPISDLNPIFQSSGCVLTVASKGGMRKLTINQDFFQGYRKTALKADEVVISLLIPFTKPDEYVFAYKQAHRREDDIAIVNAGMKVCLDEKQVIKELSLSFGGMAPYTVMAKKTMEQLVGHSWSDDMVSEACRLLSEDLPLPLGTPGGMECYRRTLTTSFFYKFYLRVKLELDRKNGDVENMSIVEPFHKEPSKGIQLFQESPDGEMVNTGVGKPVTHLSALKQATGEARYCDDMPPLQGEQYLSFVFSSKAHANIVNIDWTDALSMPGVVAKLDHTDVPGSNMTGVAIRDEEVFASKKVTYNGQIIGAIIANSQSEAQKAAKAVKVQYEDLIPIITIEQAIENESYLKFTTNSIVNGDPEKGFREADHVISGEMRVGGQEHFYLETQACIAVPTGEDGEMEVFSSTQNPTFTQVLVASALGVQNNKITCRVKRMGGGFGGKETRSVLVAVPVAIAAAKLNCSVRCMLDRDEDMILSGTRHPFLGRYRAGMNKKGIITAIDVTLYSNCGNCLDLSASVMERALFHIENAYKIANTRVKGFLCKTNTPSNTAFRGFGGPQGMMVCEAIVSHLASVSGIQEEQIREMNLYKEGEKTHYNQLVENCNLHHCWQEVMKQSEFHKHKQLILQFNSKNRWKKRGISAIPTKFGISFTAKFLNQAGALIHVYTDGSVLLTHGGTEMGQGLHTKMIQVASQALGINADKIHISETSTNTVPNTSPTAASASSDLNGMAVLNCCGIILDRLQDIVKANPKGKWEEWVNTAYMQRISLSATGYYCTPDIGYDFITNTGNAFAYYTCGAAVSQVEIDCLTGDHTVLRTDIVMDVGTSLNPAIDIGQIEGGFVQGYGMFTLEEQRYSPDGYLFTRGPGFYKIPGFGDIPIEFNVSLLKGSSNPKAVYSSKAIGEPPLFLASSVFFAIKEAIKCARIDSGKSSEFTFHSPATAEAIRMACADHFTDMFAESNPGTFKPWFVRL